MKIGVLLCQEVLKFGFKHGGMKLEGMDESKVS